MRAAVLHELGTPRYDEYDEPTAARGQTVVDVAAAGLNPIDVNKAAGRFYAGPPDLPSVTGMEGVGTLGDGRRVYFMDSVQPFGSMAERCLIEEGRAIAVPDGVDDATAVALGIAGLAAWLALEWRGRLAAGETVLVLGATGTVGLVAVQAARLLGAGRVIAAGRDPEGLRRAAEAGADATVSLEEDDLAGAFSAAAQGRLDVIVDPLWGPPAVAALQAATAHARLVQLGQSAAGAVEVPSAAIRGKLASIIGHTNLLAPQEVLADGYAKLAGHAAAGRLTVDTEAVPLAEVGDAWRRMQEGTRSKLVLVPGE